MPGQMKQLITIIVIIANEHVAVNTLQQWIIIQNSFELTENQIKYSKNNNNSIQYGWKTADVK